MRFSWVLSDLLKYSTHTHKYQEYYSYKRTHGEGLIHMFTYCKIKTDIFCVQQMFMNFAIFLSRICLSLKFVNFRFATFSCYAVLIPFRYTLIGILPFIFYRYLSCGILCHEYSLYRPRGLSIRTDITHRSVLISQ